MTFPKPLSGVKMRGKVDGELWSAGSAEYDTNGKGHLYFAMLRHQGGPRWRCYHVHDTSMEARYCSAAELARLVLDGDS